MKNIRSQGLRWLAHYVMVLLMVFRRKPPEEVARHNITVPLTERALHQLERAAILCRTTRTALAP